MAYCLLTLGQAGVADAGGTSVDFPVGKPFGILAYLSIANEPVSRDELAGVFWDNGDPARARHSLRQALSYIRQHFGADVFITDDPLELDPAVVESDVALLNAALEAGDIDRVLELYQGPFLGQVQLSSSPAWDHWVEIRRRIFEERVAAALREAAAETGDPGRALSFLRRMVTVEPHRIEHRMDLLARLLEQGDLEGATAVLAETRQADVDRSRLAEMEARVRAMREHRRASRSSGTDLYPEFVGRAGELAALTDAWHRASRGRRQLAVLSGPTGIGKTRLAQELAAIAGAVGDTVHVKASAVERRMDWSVTAELARALYRLPGAAGVGSGAEAVLRSLVPSLGGDNRSSPTIVPRSVAVSDALADLVSAVAYEGPLLIVLDDLQWVDPASLALLMRMVRQVRDEPVLVVCTFRSEEMGSREHTDINSLVDELGGVFLRLQTLSQTEIQELLTLSGLNEPAPRIQTLARRLHDITRGHPLFLVELLRSLLDDGVLVPHQEDGWQLRDAAPVALELPVSIQLVINKRLEQLSDAARTVGMHLAGLPPSVELERIQARTGLSDAAFTEAVHELLERGVVTWDANGRLTFTHDQLREALGERTSAGRRRFLRTAAVAALAAITAAGVLWLEGETADPEFGGGTILLLSDDSAAAVDASRPVDLWRPAPTDFWVPDDPEIMSAPAPWRLTDGTVAWTTALHDLVAAPEGAVYWSGDRSRWTLRWPGDDGVVGISPDGGHLLWVTEHLPTPGYDKALRVVETASDTGRVLTGPASAVEGLWSPDGTRIAIALRQERDSILVVSPGGARLMRRSYFLAGLEDWCGPDRLLAVVRDSATARLSRVVLDVRDGTETMLDSVAVRSAQCSPDGTAYVSRAPGGRGASLVLTDIDAGTRHPIPSAGGWPRIYWVPDAVGPVPVGLALGQDTDTLVRGAGTRLGARVIMSDGAHRQTDVRWTSLNPAVVSVRDDGSLAANRAGEAAVVAEFAHWLRDTARITVLDRRGGELLLSDDFRRLDTLAWQSVGEPTVRLTTVDGRPVLELLGDGRYADGLVSRRARRAPAGTTVELEFRMPLNSDQYQGFWLRLGEMSPPADPGARRTLESWENQEFIQVALPAYELDKWSPGLIKLNHHASRREAIRPLPDGTDPANWTHLALQVQADGLATLWLDRQPVASLRLPPGLLDRPLRLGIFGRTYNTRGYVRNLAWWAEPRYR